MTFKRYIYRNGKRYGPYYYHNTKINGKVISNYVGTEEDRIHTKKKHNVKIVIIVLSVIAIFTLLYVTSFLKLFPTGRQIDTPTISKKTITSTAPEPNQIDFSNTGQITTKDNPVKEPKYSVNTVQSPVVTNNPVQWKKEISLETEGPIKIQIPKESENIVVYKINTNGEKERISDPQISITAKVSSEIITDKSQVQESKIVSFFKKIFNFLTTGKAVSIQGLPTVQEITISGNEKQYEIEYTTLAPYTIESKIERGKSIKLINPSEIDYKDVLVSSNIEELKISDPDSISLYSIEKNQVINYENIEDRNDDGIYDYIEFISSDSSNQTFEIIIITKAEHLDENRIFISNIYEQVKEIDNIWSETISDKEYVRVTFEQNLTSKNDITVFPRVTEGNSKIEIYEKDGNDLIAEFTELNSNKYNKVYLTNLQGEQDTFDLKILNGNVEFDHILDPVAQPGGKVELRPQVCSGEDNAIWGTFLTACDGLYPRACGSGLDLVSCNDGTLIAETHTSNRNNRYGGIKISSYNTTINNCQSIDQVFICYERWSSSTSIAICDISVDADGDESWAVVNSTCPRTGANPGIICNNVTLSESWSCSNFFGDLGVRALAKSEFRSTSTTLRTMTWDVFFFNVIYTEDTTGPSINNPNTNTSSINQNEFFCLNATVTDTGGVSNVRVEVYNTTNWLNYTMIDTGTSCGGIASDGVYGVEIQGTSLGIWNYSKVYANDSFNNLNSYDFSDLTINVTPLITNSAPTHSNPIFLPVSPTVSQNFTCFNQTTADANGDSVANIYNWLINGTPIAVLNLPFDTNVSLSSSQTKDYSGYGRNGTCTGATCPVWTSNGKKRGAYKFGGEDLAYNWINISNSIGLSLTSQFSLETWINMAQTISADRGIVSKWDGNGYMFYQQASNAIRFYIGGTSITSSNLGINTWYHVVGTWNSTNGNMSLYVNGKLNSSGIGVAMGTNTLPVVIGTYNNRSSSVFNGTIDNVRIYNKILSASQISQIYQEEVNGYSNSSTIVTGETLTGDNWTCQITPNDAIEDGIIRQNSTMISSFVNQPPQITFVQQPLSAIPLESTFRTINFEVHVSDPNRYIDISEVNANFSKTGETTRTGTCVFQNNIDLSEANYSCSINMWYYDASGFWNITVYGKDLNGASAINDTTNITYQPLNAIVIISPSGALTWPTLKTGETNILSDNDPLVINNTGNYNGTINITAYNLIGQTNPSEFISASNFRAGQVSGSECSGTVLQNATSVLILNSNLTRGVSATEEIYFCIASVPQISSQNYSTSLGSTWTISI